jgi:acylphosphatase
MKKCLMIKITGKVQNVGFRYGALQKAHELGIYGYVRNKYNESVYIEAEGEGYKLEEFVIWCWQGPSMAHVDNVNVQDCSV